MGMIAETKLQHHVYKGERRLPLLFCIFLFKPYITFVHLSDDLLRCEGIERSPEMNEQ
jgi:hypothetical protein